MTVGILETGRPPGDLAARHGTYDDMVRRMLGGGVPARRYDVAAGELPAHPGECAGYVVTGSSAGVYEDLPWIPPLLAWLRGAHGAGARLVGLCFGHQAMAQALGGRVEKSARGWGLGVQDYDLVGELPGLEGRARVAAIASHQDQVVAAPPAARVVARSAFTPFAGLAYGEGAASVQFHPEFEPGFARALLEGRRGVVAPEVLEPALASLARPQDGAAVAGWLRRVLGVAGPG